NYRSTNTILNAANALIKNNPRRRPKQLWSAKGDGSKITLRAHPNDEDEARGIVEQIEFGRIAYRVPWADNAILFRINLQSRPLETALRKAGVRYHLIGGQSFFDRREVKDFIAYVKTFLHPLDDVSLLRIANVPARGLSDVTMERLLAASHERKSSVFAAMKSPVVQAGFQNRTRESIEKFVELIERVAAQLEPAPASARPLQSWSERFLDEIGYYAELRRGEKDADAAENRIRNLREMVATLDDFGAPDALPRARLQTFLEDITLDAERLEEKEEAGDAVTLITMHSCKGLEFPQVFIVGLEDGLLPHSRSAAEGTLEEERRLFYVAVTRAMRSLTISHCAARKKYGQLIPCHPSRFLTELPPELLEDPAANKQPVNGNTAKTMFDLMRNVAAGDVGAPKS
ncbi:MAG: ATP-dependent helicase, partial [Limisphaerales bacterium]